MTDRTEAIARQFLRLAGVSPADTPRVLLTMFPGLTFEEFERARQRVLAYYERRSEQVDRGMTPELLKELLEDEGFSAVARRAIAGARTRAGKAGND